MATRGFSSNEVEKLKLILDKHSRWQPLSEYVERIEGYRDSDFSISIENSKSLLESVAKEICFQKKQPLAGSESVSKVLSLSFGSLGYPPSDTIRLIGTAIANVGQQMGNFRNEIGTTAHGKTLDELKDRQEIVNSLTGEFLLTSTELVCCFLIESFEAENPLAPTKREVEFDDNPEFNDYWDTTYGEVKMGNFSFAASAVLFNLEPKSYRIALAEFESTINETDH